MIDEERERASEMLERVRTYTRSTTYVPVQVIELNNAIVRALRNEETGSPASTEELVSQLEALLPK